MPRYVALFRGINVGKAKRIAMADLRKLLEKLGYTAVATLLNSGNAIFTGGPRAAHPRGGEEAVRGRCGGGGQVGARGRRNHGRQRAARAGHRSREVAGGG